VTRSCIRCTRSAKILLVIELQVVTVLRRPAAACQTHTLASFFEMSNRACVRHLADVRTDGPDHAGLYGRRKMAAHLRRTAMLEASAESVHRAMRTLGLSGVRRDKGAPDHDPAKDGTRAGDLLDRDYTAPPPNRTWVRTSTT